MVQARAITVGLIGSPPLPQRVVDCDFVHILALIEAIVCENEDGAKQVQQMYEAAKPAPPVTRGERRREEINRILSI